MPSERLKSYMEMYKNDAMVELKESMLDEKNEEIMAKTREVFGLWN